MTLTTARQAALEERGQAIARRSIRRAERKWKLLSGFFKVDMTFEEFMLRRSGSEEPGRRISSLVGLRMWTSAFTGEQQEQTAEAALQRMLDELCKGRLQVRTWVAAPHGIGIQTGWSVTSNQKK